MSDPAERCDLCGGAGESANPLVPEEFYPGARLHLHCLNSAAGTRWMQARAEADPAYARYLALSTLGHEVRCSRCGSSERASPKATGMGAAHWEANCRSCHRYRPHLNAYRSAAERELCDTLGSLARAFRLNRNPTEALRRAEQLAEEGDTIPPAQACICGGRFSLAARPRCSGCQDVLLDSPFHITLPRATPV